jgi:hypothetical protein
MMKAMSELFTKNQQSTDTTLERVNAPLLESLIKLMPWRLDCHRRIKTRFPMTLVRTTTMRRRRWRMRSPSTLRIHHHGGSTVMTNRCTKSFHAFHVDQMGKVWEVTLIVALINSTLMVMMILLLKLSLGFLPSMVCMMPKLV